MPGMYGLGRLFDAGIDAVPVDLSSAAVTGKRTSMRNASAASVVFIKASSGGVDPQLVFKAATAASGGTTVLMTTNPSFYYKKSAASYDNTQTWSKVTGVNSGGTVTLTGEAGNQGIYVFEVLVDQMPDANPFLEVDTVKASTTAQLGTILVMPHDLEIARTPPNLPALDA